MKLSEPRFTFAETVAATGANEAWLRTFMQRAKENTLGTRDERLRRILFSGADIARIAVLFDLNAGLKVSPSHAWEALGAIESLIAAKAGNGEAGEDCSICIGYADDGEMLCWHVNNEGVIETFNDAADDRQFDVIMASRRAHIVFPALRMWDAVVRAKQLASASERDA